MTRPRYTIIDSNETGIYHCISRCVQRAFLCGVDSQSGKNYSYRKQWILNRMKELAGIFLIDVCGYAIMDNHLHLMLRNRPDLAEACSLEDIAKRWWQLHPQRKTKEGKPESPTQEELDLVMADPGRAEILRKRLSSISWFMSSLKQPIARMANQEVGATGRFWEGRFKAVALLDDAAILSCKAYVDLNCVRAGTAESPETSDYTSGQARIVSRQAKMAKEALAPAPGSDAFYVLEAQTIQSQWLCPLQDDGNRAGFLGLSEDEYFEILDWTGRNLISEHKGSIPEYLAPILIRLNIDPSKWVQTSCDFGKKFKRVAGTASQIEAMAKRSDQKWFAGLASSRELFLSA